MWFSNKTNKKGRGAVRRPVRGRAPAVLAALELWARGRLQRQRPRSPKRPLYRELQGLVLPSLQLHVSPPPNYPPVSTDIWTYSTLDTSSMSETIYVFGPQNSLTQEYQSLSLISLFPTLVLFFFSWQGPWHVGTATVAAVGGVGGSVRRFVAQGGAHHQVAAARAYEKE